MARKKNGLKFRPNSIEENKSVLRELRAQNKIDDRSPKHLLELFTTLNANNSSDDAKNSKKIVSLTNSNDLLGTYGPIPGCPSGSWWGIRVDCSRQGVHKPFNLDIHDGPFGAISVCTPQIAESNDVDLGNFLTLTGREYSEMYTGNESLNLSHRHCVPLRLVRSYSLSNEYSPKTGYRYDGLYVVVAHWIGESENSKKYHKFALMRLLNQEPPPWLQSNAKPSPNPRVECPKRLPNRLSCTLRRRSPKLKRQSVSSSESEKYNCEKFNYEKLSQKLSESPSISQERKGTNAITAILTRQVFKKPNASSGTTPPVSASLRTEGAGQNAYVYKKHGQSKLQNTNISVRTDLYDSSHNVQQEAKRSAPMTFCRIYKPNKSCKPTLAQEETLAVEKRTPSPDLSTDWIMRRKNIEVEKLTNPGEDTEVQRPPSISRESIYRIVGCPMSNELVDEVGFTRRNLQPDDCQEKNISESRKSSVKSTSSESSNSLEALTPDQILNLVVKEKRNPMAKLLIGNVIGLSIEESKVIRAYNALISKDSKANENVDCQSDNSLKATPKFKMISKRILRHDRNDENRKNYSKLAKRNRSCTDACQKTGANPKFNDDPGGAIGYSRSVNRANVPEDSKLKKSPGCKKQRREIANLVIDAKVGPIIRGPRNRRLRHQSHKRIGKERDGFIGNSSFPRRRGILNKQSKRSELSKRRKRLSGRITKVRKLQSGNINLNLVRGKRSKALESSRNFQEMLTRDSEVQKPPVESSGDQSINKSKMVDAMAQCSLISEPSIDSSVQTSSDLEHSMDPSYSISRQSIIKIEEIDLDDIKSEDGADFSEVESVTSHECLNSFESEKSFLRLKANVNSNCRSIKNRRLDSLYNLYPLIHRESAFVPVNSSSSLKIARLRSIGFRPIEAESDCAGISSRSSEDRENPDTSARKDADEDYNKYTNEETSDVGYMDDDLHYEDIENEDRTIINKRKKKLKNKAAPPTKYIVTNTPCSIRSMDSTLSSMQNQSLEESLDIPWHGWKKITSEKGDQWIGW